MRDGQVFPPRPRPCRLPALTCTAALVAGALAAAVAMTPPAHAQGAAATPPAAAGSAAGKCGVCHPAERVQFETSSHAREQVRCVSCHGGDDKSLEQPVAHGGGFRGRPARSAIPALCASCHASEERMRPYNLPVDQYALYQTSGHGLRLARGETRVAVCSDCHGAHDILSPSDPGSRVFLTNIPRTCGRCHGDSTVVTRNHAVFADYSMSVHAQALLDRGNLRSPTCVSCHGVHGAAPPALGDVDKVCGRCHTAERRYFSAGKHRPGPRGGPECSTCHGAHGIVAARPERLPESCADCHGQGSREAALGKQLWSEYRSAAGAVDKAAAAATQAEAVPINTDDYRARLEEAKTYLREALPAAHAVREDLVVGFTNRALSVAHEVESELDNKLGHRKVWRYVVILFWFYILLTILVLRRFQRRGAGSA